MEPKIYYECRWAIVGMDKPLGTARPEGTIRTFDMDVAQTVINALEAKYADRCSVAVETIVCFETPNKRKRFLFTEDKRGGIRYQELKD